MPSDLPIVTPDPPPPPPASRRSAAERYGGLFYFGVGGLAVVLVLVGWFAREVYRMRGVWRAVYVLHDASRPADDRIQAAHALTREPNVSARQLWDIALRTDLPPLARYLVAEALPAGAATSDPRGYALAVARSPGWPDWLRVLLARPMAYAAVGGTRFPPEALVEARRAFPDPSLHAWLLTAQARNEVESKPAGPTAVATLEALAQSAPAGRRREPATLLRSLRLSTDAAVAQFDLATAVLRAEHPGAAALWSGWEQSGGVLLRTSAPILPRSAPAATGTRVPAPAADGPPARSPLDDPPPRPAPDDPRPPAR
jgi:hypothetical protein